MYQNRNVDINKRRLIAYISRVEKLLMSYTCTDEHTHNSAGLFTKSYSAQRQVSNQHPPLQQQQQQKDITQNQHVVASGKCASDRNAALIRRPRPAVIHRFVTGSYVVYSVVEYTESAGSNWSDCAQSLKLLSGSGSNLVWHY